MRVLLSTLSFDQTGTNADDHKEFTCNTVTVIRTAEWLPDMERSRGTENCA